MRERTLYCIVADPRLAANAKPDTMAYSPKELAFKEGVSVTSVYTWIRSGLPVMRRGDKGNILIQYQDYIQWMIDCAKDEAPGHEVPSWAFRFVKAATPPRQKSVQNQQKEPSVAVSAPDPSKGAENAKKAYRPPKNASNHAGNGQLSLFDLAAFAV